MMRQQHASNQQLKYPFFNSTNGNSQINKFSQPLSQKYMQQLHSNTHSSDNIPSRQQCLNDYIIKDASLRYPESCYRDSQICFQGSSLGQNSQEGSRSLSPSLIHLINDNKEKQSILHSGYQQRIAQVLNTQSQIFAASAEQLPQLSDAKSSTNKNLRTSYKEFLKQSASPKPFGSFNGNNIISDFTIGGYSSHNQSNHNNASSTLKNNNQYADYNEAIRQLKKKKLELKSNQNISHKQNDFTFANNTEQTTSPKLQDSGDYEKRSTQESLPLLNQFIQKPVLKLTQNGVQSFYNVEEMEQTLSFKSKLKISQPCQVQILKHILDSGENQKRLRKDMKTPNDIEGNLLSQSQKIIPIHPQKHLKMEQNINLETQKGGISPHLNHIYPNLSQIGMQYPRLANSNFNTSLPNLSNQKISQSQTINVENLEQQQQLGDLSLQNIQKIAIDKYLQDLSLDDLQQIVRINQPSSLVQKSTASNNFANSITISTQQNNMGYMGSDESQRGSNLTLQPVSSNFQDSSPFAKHIKNSIINDNDERSKSPIRYQISQQISIKEKTKFGPPPTHQVIQLRPINSQLQLLPFAPKSRPINSRQKMKSISNLDSKKFNDYNQITNEFQSSALQWPLTPMLQSTAQSDQEANKTPPAKIKVFNFPNDPGEESKLKYQQDSIFVQNQQENYFKQPQNREEEIKVADSKGLPVSPFAKPFKVNYKQKNPTIIEQDRQQFFQQMNQPRQSNGGVTSNSLCTSADLRSPLIKTPVEVHPPIILPILSSMPPSPNMRASNNYKGFGDDEETNADPKHHQSIGETLETQHQGMNQMPGFEGSTPHLRSLEEIASSFNLNQDSSSKNFGVERSGDGFQHSLNNESQESINQEEINMAVGLVQKKREIIMLKDIRDMLQQLKTFRNNKPETSETLGASPPKQNAGIQCNLPNEVAIQTDIIAPNSEIPLNDPKEFLRYIKEHLMDIQAESDHQGPSDHHHIEDLRRISLHVPKSVKQMTAKQISYHKLLSQNSQVLKTQSDQNDEFFNSKIDIGASIIHHSQDITKNKKQDSFERFNSPNPCVIPQEESSPTIQLDLHINETTQNKQGSLSHIAPAISSIQSLGKTQQIKLSQHLSTQRLVPSVKDQQKRNTLNEVAGQRRSSMKQSKKSSGLNLENHIPHHVHFTDEEPSPEKQDFQKQKSAKRSEFSEARKTVNSKHSKKTDGDNKSSKSKKQTIIILNNPVMQTSGEKDSSVFDRQKTIKINLNSLDGKIQQGIKHIFQAKSPLLSRQISQFQGTNNVPYQGTLTISRQGTTFKLQETSLPPETEHPFQQQKTIMQAATEFVPKEKRKVNNKLNFAANLLFKIAPNKKDKKNAELEQQQEIIEMASVMEEQKSNAPEAPKGRRRYQDYIKKEDGDTDQTNTKMQSVNDENPQNESPQQAKKNVEQTTTVDHQQYQFTHSKSYSKFTKKTEANKINNESQKSTDHSPPKTQYVTPNNQGRASIKNEVPRKINKVHIPPLKLPLTKINNNSYEESSSNSSDNSSYKNRERLHQALSTQKQKFPQVSMLNEVQEQFEEDMSEKHNNKKDTKGSAQEFKKLPYAMEKTSIVQLQQLPQESMKTYNKMDTQIHSTGRLGPAQKNSGSSVKVNHQKTKEIFQSKIRQIPMLKMSSSSMLKLGKLM